MYVVWSQDGGATWDGGGGLIPGSAATAYLVNPPSEGGTHFFPAIAAHDPGQVDVAYLYTPTILPTDPFGKADPGGCGGGLPIYPPACSWDLYAGQSVNLTADTTHATWTTTKVTPVPMHVGDICNLGIACIPKLSNRHLADFIQETIDPTTGCAHIGYADDNTVKKLRVANQVSGCFPVAAVAAATAPMATPASTPTPTPEPTAHTLPNTSAAAPSGISIALAAAGLLAVGLPALRRRRRRRSS
jgi:MYXO-CTERM domain-containing protein